MHEYFSRLEGVLHALRQTDVVVEEGKEMRGGHRARNHNRTLLIQTNTSATSEKEASSINCCTYGFEWQGQGK